MIFFMTCFTNLSLSEFSIIISIKEAISGDQKPLLSRDRNLKVSNSTFQLCLFPAKIHP